MPKSAQNWSSVHYGPLGPSPKHNSNFFVNSLIDGTKCHEMTNIGLGLVDRSISYLIKPITVPPSLIEENGTSNAASSPSAPPQFLPSSPSAPPPPPRGRPPHQQVPSAKLPPPLRGGVGIGTVHQQKQQMPKDGQKIVVRSKEWFREEFDVQSERAEK